MVRFRVRFQGLALAAVVAAGALAAGRALAADGTPIPPAPTQFVTDHAGLMSPGGAAQLSRQLEDYERGTGHQVIVWIDRTTGGVPIEDWAVKAFAAWGVGRKGENDGAALFIFRDDRRMRIEVGYGLEDKVPDARAGRIVNDVIAPRLRAGDADGGVKAGVAALLAAIGGAPEPRHAAPTGSPLAVLSPILLAVVILLIARRHPWALLLIGGGRGGGWGGGGGGWGGGGGFSGGGGSSGGGGASGGW